MADPGSPFTESSAVDPPPVAKVFTSEVAMAVLAGVAVLGLVRPVTVHDTTTLRATAVVTVITRLGVL